MADAAVDSAADVVPDGATLQPLTRTAYVKASNTDPGDRFGVHVAISGDGSTLAIGAPSEGSAATGIDGNQDNSSAAPMFGAVYVFVRSGATWVQQAYVKASISTQGYFGTSVALSADGSTLAVGAYMDPQPSSEGAAYVFTRTGTTWSQQARLQAPTPQSYAFFGWSIALSADGNTLAVGAYDENSVGAVNVTQTFAGAVHIYTRSGTTWTHQSMLKGAQTEQLDYVGMSLSLSADGNTVAFGAPGESGGSTGINGDETSNTSEASGAIYVATRSGTTWTQQAYVKPSELCFHCGFGTNVALSGDGNTLAAGVMMQNDTTGRVFMFARTGGTTWMQQAAVDEPNAQQGDEFGWSVALNDDGSVLLASSTGDDSGTTDPADNTKMDSGAVYLLARTGATWVATTYAKASNIDANDMFGVSVAASASATTFVVGALKEASNATGVGGDETNNADADAGAAYVFER